MNNSDNCVLYNGNSWQKCTKDSVCPSTNSDVIVNVVKEYFSSDVEQYFNYKDTNKKVQYWSKFRVANTIQIIEGHKMAPNLGKIRSPLHYNRAKIYDVMEVGNEKALIFKAKNSRLPNNYHRPHWRILFDPFRVQEVMEVDTK